MKSDISKGECCKKCTDYDNDGGLACADPSCKCHQEPVGANVFEDGPYREHLHASIITGALDNMYHSKEPVGEKKPWNQQIVDRLKEGIPQSGYKEVSKEPSWVAEFDAKWPMVFSGNGVDQSRKLKYFISRFRQEAFEEGYKKGKEQYGSEEVDFEDLCKSGYKQGHKDALTSLLAQIPEESENITAGENYMIRTIRELINAHLNKLE